MPPRRRPRIIYSDERVLQVMQTGDVAVDPNRFDHLVVKDITKTYQVEADSIESVRLVSLSLRQGEFVSILGPSGCGKSTLLMMIAGLVAPTSGEILLDGKRIVGPRRETSVIFQTPVLFPWRTVLSNVLFPLEVFGLAKSKYRSEALRLLELTGLSRLRGSAAETSFRRDGPARAAMPRADHQSGGAADGRTVQRPRRSDA